MSESQKGNLKFVTHRPKDALDPGFRILGAKLRWIAATQTEDKMGRIWQVLRKDQVPKELLEQMRKSGREIFGSDNTIRKRELVLAWADEAAVAEERAMLDRAARSQLSQVTSKSVPGGNRHMKVEEAEMTKVSGSEFFNN